MSQRLLIVAVVLYGISLYLLSKLWNNIEFSMPLLALACLVCSAICSLYVPSCSGGANLRRIEAIILLFVVVSVLPTLICCGVYLVQDYIPIGLIGALFSWLVAPAIAVGAYLICFSSVCYALIFVVSRKKRSEA